METQDSVQRRNPPRLCRTRPVLTEQQRHDILHADTDSSDEDSDFLPDANGEIQEDTTDNDDDDEMDLDTDATDTASIESDL